MSSKPGAPSAGSPRSVAHHRQSWALVFRHSCVLRISRLQSVDDIEVYAMHAPRTSARLIVTRSSFRGLRMPAAGREKMGRCDACIAGV